ncbi:cytochrome c554 and C-prime [Leptospira sp. 2 VSF19]|uniref:Cytochrome c554 and C-prime n=1 Tax=Leptospira soteropolitanensis TaxID=2950025 RepID=A0AAW5VPW3_9LEPT|nr:multiheme c-type cytochrome [Leptospira soteropolitanensis]MCW7493342.1 cytochrome c554 and C-prime [Leptospira soteropolitanensis]MCW7501126.1 cytochrome c554 and C-prime [Leptospira soteropolitanensis]MCW7523194.1 cytochrome c554 and C-prime [Leptospira soteropolitanensis]MCW7527055.1 cytochrome c554 and C-prime [Leptospira soteropolitanensis]MCW7530912.1 cytochrome c554 and C-prime [Leptospira soteropolitanensis]
MTFLSNQLTAIALSVIFVSCLDSNFLESHWKNPIVAQGLPPEHFSVLEKNLEPSACQTCHNKQFQNWKESFHSKSIGKGFLWQKDILSSEEYRSCFQCHSPLAETKSELSKEYQTEEILNSKLHNFPNGISNPSILCASCHIRNQIRFGPPPSTNAKDKLSIANLPHNGYIAKKEFESSEFCKSCHESKQDGIRLNGKKLMEVYTEWEKSPFAKQGIHCQNCHMPDREHSWKGIHDKTFVQNSLLPKWKITEKNGIYQVQAELKSIAVGHEFPTYLVPKVYLRFYVFFKNGTNPILLEESIIGRIVNTSLTEEYLDTRIKPQKSHQVSFDYDPKEKKVQKFLWEIEIDPDEQYVRNFEEQLTKNKEKLSAESKKLLQESLTEKKNSRYLLFTLNWQVPVLLPQ